MNSNIARKTLLILSVATLYMSMAATARAGGLCSLDRAAGDWALSNSGTVIGFGLRVPEGVLTLYAAGNVLNANWEKATPRSDENASGARNNRRRIAGAVRPLSAGRKLP